MSNTCMYVFVKIDAGFLSWPDWFRRRQSAKSGRKLKDLLCQLKLELPSFISRFCVCET